MATSIAKISLAFDLNHQEIVEKFKVAMVKETHKQEPEKSNVQLAARCGVDRRFVAKCLSDEKVSNQFNSTHSKIKDVFNAIDTLTGKLKTDRIIKFGGTVSFNSICEKIVGKNITPLAVATELIRKGLIEDDGDYYKMVNRTYMPDAGDAGYLIPFIRHLKGLTSTVIDNRKAYDQSFTKTQRTIYSTQIPPENIIPCVQMLQSEFNKFIHFIRPEFDKFETASKIGTYPETGMTFLVYTEDMRCPVDPKTLGKKPKD